MVEVDGGDFGGDLGSDASFDTGSDIGGDLGGDSLDLSGDDLSGDLGDLSGDDMGEGFDDLSGEDLSDGSDDLFSDDISDEGSEDFSDDFMDEGSDDLTGEDLLDSESDDLSDGDVPEDDLGDLSEDDLSSDELSDTPEDLTDDTDIPEEEDLADEDLSSEDLTEEPDDVPEDTVEEETDDLTPDEDLSEDDLIQEDLPDDVVSEDDGPGEEDLDADVQEDLGEDQEADDGYLDVQDDDGAGQETYADIPHDEDVPDPDTMQDTAADTAEPQDDVTDIAPQTEEGSDAAEPDTGRSYGDYETGPEKELVNEPETMGEKPPADNPYAEQWEDFEENAPPFRGSETQDTVPAPENDLEARMDQIMNSDLSTQEKIDQLNELRNEVVASQESQNDTFDQADLQTEEEGGPVKVLKMGQGDTVMSHPDYEQQLYDLDEGITNWDGVQREAYNDIRAEHDRIMSDTSLTTEQQYDMLEQNAQRERNFLDNYANEYSELQSQREELARKAGLDGTVPYVQDQITENNVLQMPGDTVDSSLQRYELPENAEMIRSSDDLDMSEAMGLDDPNFWNHHGNTYEDYHELASHLPEVQQRLDAGESLDSLRRDPVVGATANQYYNQEHMIRLNRGETGGYRFIGDGRHRVLAARDQGLDFPAVIDDER